MHFYLLASCTASVTLAPYVVVRISSVSLGFQRDREPCGELLDTPDLAQWAKCLETFSTPHVG